MPDWATQATTPKAIELTGWPSVTAQRRVRFQHMPEAVQPERLARSKQPAQQESVQPVQPVGRRPLRSKETPVWHQDYEMSAVNNVHRMPSVDD